MHRALRSSLPLASFSPSTLSLPSPLPGSPLGSSVGWTGKNNPHLHLCEPFPLHYGCGSTSMAFRSPAKGKVCGQWRYIPFSSLGQTFLTRFFIMCHGGLKLTMITVPISSHAGMMDRTTPILLLSRLLLYCSILRVRCFVISCPLASRVVTICLRTVHPFIVNKHTELFINAVH